jgi:RNA polymerase sigma factor (sigma-70 family)
MTQQRGQETLWSDAADLFSRWREGETSAMDDLVRLLTPVLWQIARAQRLDEETAGDVVQSAWLALVRRPEAVRDAAAVGGWLATTTRREAWRATKKHSRTDLMAEEDLPMPASESAEDEATVHLRDQMLWGAVGQLNERCQRLLRVAAFLDRPNYQQLAEDLEMPVGSIGPTRGRCLAKLRSLLEPEGGHHG